MRYAILVAYDGTAYGGWQVQKNVISVQEKIEQAAFEIFGKNISVKASGRTDSGVHAAGQVCHFDAETTIPSEKIAEVFNMHLPEDISILQSVEAPANFDANRNAKKKTYCYRVYFSACRNPLKDRYAVWLKNTVDFKKLDYISKIFEGTHDFKAYCKSGSAVLTTVRQVYSVNVVKKQTNFGTDLEIYVCGGGFLYNMVRTIVGTMLYYASGALTEEDIRRSLTKCDRNLVGKTMPAKGLTLENVDYGFELFKAP